MTHRPQTSTLFPYTTLFRSSRREQRRKVDAALGTLARRAEGRGRRDRKSTRLNSSHLGISYAVFCLKKKKQKQIKKKLYKRTYTSQLIHYVSIPYEKTLYRH